MIFNHSIALTGNKICMWVQDRVFSPQSASELVHHANGQKFALFYNSGEMLEKCLDGHLSLVEAVRSELGTLDYQCILVDPQGNKLIQAENVLNIWMLDPLPNPNSGPNLFYLAPSYLHGFWTFEKTGLRNHSDRQTKAFKPEDMPSEKVKEFFSFLYEKFVAQKKTNWPQEASGAVAIPEGVWTIALQGNATMTDYPVYFDYPSLIEKLIQIKGTNKLWIKPHPRMGPLSIVRYLEYHDPENGVFFGACNLHDLLAKTEIVFTRCSAVALEAMLHKVPAIVGGQVDFAHGVETVRSLDQMETTIDLIRQREFDYESYLFWFLKRQHFEPRRKSHTIHRIKKLLASL